MSMCEEEWGQTAPVEAAARASLDEITKGLDLNTSCSYTSCFNLWLPGWKLNVKKKMRIETESYQEAAADLQKRQRRGWDSNRSYNQDKNLAVTAVCILRQHACA